MKLLTDELWAQLPTLYAQENEKDPIIHVKFFTPSWTDWTWFLTEESQAQEDDDFICFGCVIGLEGEWGYFSLREIESVRGPAGLTIERDLYFTPRRKSEIPDFQIVEQINRGQERFPTLSFYDKRKVDFGLFLGRFWVEILGHNLGTEVPK